VNETDGKRPEKTSMAAPTWVYERAPTRRPLGRRLIAAGIAALAAITVILVVPALLSSPDRLPTIDASARSEGGSLAPSPSPHPSMNSPRPATSRSASPKPSPAVSSSAALSPQPSSAGSSPEAVENVHIGRVRHIRQGRLLSATVVITDPNTSLWLPPSDVTFRALDRHGKVIATYQTTVTIGPGGSKIVVAPLLYLGPNVRAFRSVDVVLDRARWQPTSTFVPTHVRVSGEHVARDGGFTVVKGHIANRGQRSVAVQISCSLWSGDHLAGVGIATVPRLRSGIDARFIVPAQFVDRTPDAADCTVALII
jgi:hypothetical protein